MAIGLKQLLLMIFIVIILPYLLLTAMAANETEEMRRYCNATGTFIPRQHVCDRFQDCPDDSDEINCACNATYQYSCQNGRCIYKEWLCDGVKDCPLGDDEIPPQCVECPYPEFRCEDSGRCIISNKLCDGRSDCDDASDESLCVGFAGDGATAGTRVLVATFFGVHLHRICAAGWNMHATTFICSFLGFESALTFSSIPHKGIFVLINGLGSSFNVMDFFQGSLCPAQLAVAIACTPPGCGNGSINAARNGTYVLNEQRAVRGAWPWHAVVYTGYTSRGKFIPITICGGTVIDSRWILTAAHCTQITKYYSQIGYTGQLKPGNIQVLLGTISLKDNPDKITAYVDQVHTHPEYDANDINNDISLLRLSQPVSYSDTVKPICFPAPIQDIELSRFKLCVNTGFGWTLRSTASQNLLQVKMKILSDKECTRVHKNYRGGTQICIAALPTSSDINMCSGDSGGPLSCQDPHGFWKVIGVNSYGVRVSDSSRLRVDRCRLLVVARVSWFRDWINETMLANAV